MGIAALHPSYKSSILGSNSFGFSEFDLTSDPTQMLNALSHPIEGRFAVVTNVGRDAVDAECATDERA
ncbi:hypothetical protein AAFG07_25025 [Bradyrhizobium sp. B097]|uniref:hypothetical protein n=1 Tax=Bradyrhizobium sp. B097 TaxID=3140244 RepID=UPI003183C017